MPATVHLDRGEGPGVVLLHGVGAGPATFDTVADGLVPGHRVLVVERPAGEDGGPGLPLGEQADRLVSLLEGEGAIGAAVVGVSGGATVALALAIRHPGAASALVVHEPLVGRHAPNLHERFRAAAELAATGDDAAISVVRSVMGDRTWAALAADQRDAIVAEAPRWRAEIPQFAAFDPTEAELRSLGALPVLVTVGGRSGEERYAAAGVLARLAGAAVEVVPGAGNAVQLDAPVPFARLVRTWLAVPAGANP